MCLARKPTAVFPAAWFQPPEKATVIDVSRSIPESATVRRRKRLWELTSSASCPVLGVCLTLPDQRRLMDKCGLDTTQRSDYELHQIGVTECRRRTPFAEKVERHLDAAFASELRTVKALADADALQHCWKRARQQPGWAGMMWAVITHPACLLPLEHEVLGDVHMMQHQVGMVNRVEQQRWEDLQRKADQWQRACRDWEARWDEHQRTQQHKQHSLQQELAQLRQQLIQSEAQQLKLTQQIDDLHQSLQQQATLKAQQQDIALLRTENQALARALKQAARQAQRREETEAHADASQTPGGGDATEEADGSSPMLDGQAVGKNPPKRVACVGGRTAQLPGYRAVVESHGLELLHHDGGEEDNLGQLPATLAAADLVICQVGCISHNAYWRVKDHCKRHGKPCVFVESSSRSALERTMTRIIAAWPKPLH
jgi:hypothetical protein